MADSPLHEAMRDAAPHPLRYLQVRLCPRCGGAVLDPDRHARWHGGVDSNQTIDLPGDRPG